LHSQKNILMWWLW